VFRRLFFCRLASVSVLVVCIAGADCVLAQSSTHTIQSRLQAREVVEGHLKSFSTKNLEREGLIRKWFAESGCQEADLSEETIGRSLPPNVICVLPGETSEVIVVGAHTDHVDSYGDGVVDNWTGAVLLPALVYSLIAAPRHHTFLLVGFSGEEKGLVGSRYYVEHLSGEQRSRIVGMVNFDSLGMSPTKVWASHADKMLLDALIATATAGHLPLAVMNVESVAPRASADSESFARYHIPRITLHSVTEQTWQVLHSPFDKMNAIRMKDYYESYQLIAEYLVYLGSLLGASGEKAGR
jgi:hypothetical protein